MALPKILSVDEFIRWVDRQESKYEFFGGRVHRHVVAMAGGTTRHNIIEANVVAALHNRLRGSGCRTYGSNQLVKNKERGEAFFPDASIVCGPMEQERHGTLDAATNPAAVFEVLSPTTEKHDRYQKLDSYQSMPSVREVVLVVTKAPRVERYVRTSDGWRFEATVGLGSTATVFDLEIPLAELYETLTSRRSRKSRRTATLVRWSRKRRSPPGCAPEPWTSSSANPTSSAPARPSDASSRAISSAP